MFGKPILVRINLLRALAAMVLLWINLWITSCAGMQPGCNRDVGINSLL